MLTLLKKLIGLELDKPRVLYKYISSEKIKFYFPNLTIAYPKLHLLNDPMEGTVDDMLKYIKDVTHIEDNLKYLYGQPFLTDEGYQLRAFTYMEWVWKTAKNRKLKKKYDLLTFCKSNIGILSLTTDPLNPLMWSLYANVYNGICIGFKTEKLISMGFENSDNFDECWKLFELLKIRYKQKSPSNINSNLETYILSAFNTKFNNWKHEKEYRIISAKVWSVCHTHYYQVWWTNDRWYVNANEFGGRLGWELGSSS